LTSLPLKQLLDFIF